MMTVLYPQSPFFFHLSAVLYPLSSEHYIQSFVLSLKSLVKSSQFKVITPNFLVQGLSSKSSPLYQDKSQNEVAKRIY